MARARGPRPGGTDGAGAGGRAKPAGAGPKAGGKAGTKAGTTAGRGAAAAAPDGAGRGWTPAALAVVLGALALRLGFDALGAIPVHFDEAQYWAYGQELAWGYYSKPPGVAAATRLTTDLLGDSLLALRLASPLAHAGIAWMLFLTGARLWGARTGFWAALAYTAAPGVGVSAFLVSTDPLMMLGWAVALHALVRAGEPGAPRWWWAVLGAALGLAVLAKYTALAFAAAALGWGLFSARGRDLAGTAVAAAAAGLVMLPNLLWNAANGFATLTHVAEDADPGRGYGNPAGLAEFLGAQLGVIGPVVFLGILAALWRWRDWRADPAMRLMAWMTVVLLVPMAGLAGVTRAQPNWAAPAYLGGTLMAVRWLLLQERRRLLLWGQGVAGIAAQAVVAGLALLYAARGPELPRLADPFKKMRISEPFCAAALAAMDEEGVEVLLSDSRRRLSECMFLGTLGWDRVAIWNPSLIPDSHHALVATLQPGDARPMLLAVLGDGGAIAARFDQAEEIERGRVRTHADREIGYSLWRVEGFRGYDRAY